MEHYIIDTNFFFNLEIKTGLGERPQEIIERMTHFARVGKKAGKVAFYMPPKVVDEMLTFVEKDEDYVQEYLSAVTVKAPQRSEIKIPGSVFYSYVEEVRERTHRGLQVAEEEMKRTAHEMMKESELSHIDFQKKSGTYVTKLRDRFRNATRTKFLDSAADVDVLLLAKELNGVVVSSDEGVLIWARKLGIKEAVPRVLKQELESMLGSE